MLTTGTVQKWNGEIGFVQEEDGYLYPFDREGVDSKTAKCIIPGTQVKFHKSKTATGDLIIRGLTLVTTLGALKFLCMG